MCFPWEIQAVSEFPTQYNHVFRQSHCYLLKPTGELHKKTWSNCKPTNLFSHHELINDGFYFILEIQCFQLTHFIRFESSPASLGLSSIKTFSNDSWVNLWMGFYGFRHMLSISIHWTIVMVLMKIPTTIVPDEANYLITQYKSPFCSFIKLITHLDWLHLLRINKS